MIQWTVPEHPPFVTSWLHLLQWGLCLWEHSYLPWKPCQLQCSRSSKTKINVRKSSSGSATSWAWKNEHFPWQTRACSCPSLIVTSKCEKRKPLGLSMAWILLQVRSGTRVAEIDASTGKRKCCPRGWEEEGQSLPSQLHSGQSKHCQEIRAVFKNWAAEEARFVEEKIKQAVEEHVPLSRSADFQGARPSRVLARMGWFKSLCLIRSKNVNKIKRNLHEMFYSAEFSLKFKLAREKKKRLNIINKVKFLEEPSHVSHKCAVVSKEPLVYVLSKLTTI